MDLHLAHALIDKQTACHVSYLDDGPPQDAVYSQLMIEREVFVLPGDLLAVDRNTKPPTVVFRWRRTSVERLDGEAVYTDPALSTYQPQKLRLGLDVALAPGDEVYIAFGEVRDVCIAGLPAHPEYLRAVAFPEIEAMYR